MIIYPGKRKQGSSSKEKKTRVYKVFDQCAKPRKYGLVEKPGSENKQLTRSEPIQEALGNGGKAN